jgi:hypothetical protein
LIQGVIFVKKLFSVNRLLSTALLSASLLFNPSVQAQTVWTVNVIKINSYAGAATGKYVFVTDGIGSACPGGGLYFDGSGEGGKGLYSLLLTALVTGKAVQLYINGNGYGCTLLEAYITR